MTGILRADFYHRLEALIELRPADEVVLRIVQHGLNGPLSVLSKQDIVAWCWTVCQATEELPERTRRAHVLALLCGAIGCALPARLPARLEGP